MMVETTLTPEPPEPLSWLTIGKLTPEQATARRTEIQAFMRDNPIDGAAGAKNREDLKRQQTYGPPSPSGAEPVTWEMISKITPEKYALRRYDIQKFLRDNKYRKAS